jgi:cytochrome c oxidase subunit II
MRATILVLGLALAACGKSAGPSQVRQPMPAKVAPVEADDAKRVPEPVEDDAPVPAAVLVQRLGCNSCHTLDGSASVGLSMKGMFGKAVTLADGATVLVDELFIRESILEPQAKITKGFNPLMPSYKGNITDAQITAIVAYYEELK